MSDNYSLEIKTVQSAAFRVLTEALKEILTDANFEIDSTGIKVMAMDSSHTVLVHLLPLLPLILNFQQPYLLAQHLKNIAWPFYD